MYCIVYIKKTTKITIILQSNARKTLHGQVESGRRIAVARAVRAERLWCVLFNHCLDARDGRVLVFLFVLLLVVLAFVFALVLLFVFLLFLRLFVGHGNEHGNG